MTYLLNKFLNILFPGAIAPSWGLPIGLPIGFLQAGGRVDERAFHQALKKGSIAIHPKKGQ